MAMVLFAAAACAAPAAVSTPGPTATSAPAATSPAASQPVATFAATTKPAVSPTVDLTFTGDFPLVAKGSGGACHLGHGPDGAVTVFAFLASEADFPGLATSFDIEEDGASHQVSVKWVLADFFIAGVFPSGVTVAPDHKSVTFDADMPAGIERTEHLKGSIVCP